MGNRPGLGKAQTRRKVWRMHSKNPVSSRGGRAVARSSHNGGLESSVRGVPNVAFYSHSLHIPRVFY